MRSSAFRAAGLFISHKHTATQVGIVFGQIFYHHHVVVLGNHNQFLLMSPIAGLLLEKNVGRMPSENMPDDRLSGRDIENRMIGHEA